MTQKLLWDRVGPNLIAAGGAGAAGGDGEPYYYIEPDREGRYHLCCDCDKLGMFDRLEKAFDFAKTHANRLFSEPTTTREETETGPVFAFSGGMTKEPEFELFTVKNGVRVDELIPFVPTAKPPDVYDMSKRPDLSQWQPAFKLPTPYSITERMDTYEVTLTFATCEEMVSYARGLNVGDFIEPAKEANRENKS